MEINKINETEYEVVRKVKIHKNSVEPIKDRIKDGVFIGYKGLEYKENKKMLDELSKNKKQMNRCVIHLIPVEDTLDIETGCCWGISDSLFFKAIVYNLDTMEYCIRYNVDTIFSNIPYHTRIFKDMSTMVIVNQPCTVNGSVALYIDGEKK